MQRTNVENPSILELQRGVPAKWYCNGGASGWAIGRPPGNTKLPIRDRLLGKNLGILSEDMNSKVLQSLRETAELSDYVKVSSKGLEKLVKEVIQLKQSLSKVLVVNRVSLLYKKIYSLEQEVSNLKTELDRKVNEAEYRTKKCNELLREAEKHREENFQLKNTVNVLTEERFDAYGEYLSFVGICLSLLWRVSLNDECVTAMLSRKTIINFLDFISRSLDSFLETYKQGNQVDSNSDEYGLILSVSGIITNIAATAFGREFLVTKEAGTRVIDALILFLSETPAQRSAQIKNLILKAIYNTSINNKGLKYLASKKGLMTTLGWLLQEETDGELCLSLIKCIQSLIIEPDSASLAHEIMEVVSIKKLQEYADLFKGDLKTATLELISDLTAFIASQPEGF